MTAVDDVAAVRAALGEDSWLARMLTARTRSTTDALDAFLWHLEPITQVGGTRTQCRQYFVACDRNGRARVDELVRKLTANVVDFCIPRTRVAEAAEAYHRTGSMEQVVRLQAEASSLFTHLTESGEGGELLLYLLLETVLQAPQVLCKMPFKTSSEMHVHGADGVHATALEDGGLAVYWGESKLYASVSDAVRAGMKSLAEMLVGDSAHARRDMLLVRDHADLGDPLLTTALRTFFDESDVNSTRVEFRGACLVGFDLNSYPNVSALGDNVEHEVRDAIGRWIGMVERAVGKHELTSVELEIFFVPVPSVATFRTMIRQALGG